MQQELYSHKPLSLMEIAELFKHTSKPVYLDNMPFRRFGKLGEHEIPVSLREGRMWNPGSILCGYALDKLDDIENTSLQRYGPVNQVVSKRLERVTIEPDGYMVLKLMSNEKKKLRKEFKELGFRVYPPRYENGTSVFVYVNKTKDMMEIKPDVIIDKKTVEINPENADIFLPVLEDYLERKAQCGPDGI